MNTPSPQNNCILKNNSNYERAKTLFREFKENKSSKNQFLSYDGVRRIIKISKLSDLRLNKKEESESNYFSIHLHSGNNHSTPVTSYSFYPDGDCISGYYNLPIDKYNAKKVLDSIENCIKESKQNDPDGYSIKTKSFVKGIVEQFSFLLEVDDTVCQ